MFVPLQQINKVIKNYQKTACENLLYTSPENIIKTTSFLHECLQSHSNIKDDTDKEFFYKKKDWFLKRKAFNAKTSGTTTGVPFRYLIDAEFYPFVEFQCRYRLIIKEFSIDCKNILFLLKTNINTSKKVIYNNKPSISSHGTIDTKTHFINWETDIFETIKIAVDYLINNKIDVILADGAIINALTDFIKNKNIKNKLCKLLSNTNEKLFTEDANYLLKNDNIDYWCDHMRCWDGGASFTTCPFYKYHILENLSYVQEKNGKLISTDFFNLASPFINYWNGDLCQIDNNYQLCQCKRWYRPFVFIKQREWSVHGITSDQIKEKIKSFKIPNIKQVMCSDRQITIISNTDLSNEDKMKITNKLEQFNIHFTKSV